MKKLVLVMVVLALCVPSYGAVLVFNVKATFNPVMIFSSAGETTGDAYKGSFQAYAVINVDSSTGAVSQAVNEVPATIVYGTFNKQKVQQTFGNGDPNSTIAISTVNGNHANSVRPFQSSNPKVGYEWFDCEVSDAVTGFDLNIQGALGKITSASNFGGTATDVLASKKLKGTAIFEVPSASRPIVAMGTAALSINTKYTVYANTNTQTVAQMVAIIQADLAKKKFLAGNVVAAILDF